MTRFQNKNKKQQNNISLEHQTNIRRKWTSVTLYDYLQYPGTSLHK
jgi:hypothetical protein